MTYQAHELSNIFAVEKYFNKLSADDISRRYFNGEKYQSSFKTQLHLLFSADSILSELRNFYPYEPLVKRTAELYKETSENTHNLALGVSAVGLFTIYQSAKQNIVLPVLSKFGKVFNTHRILRQYIWVATLPYLLASAYTNFYWKDQIQHLWTVHAERMNRKLLRDPQSSQIPKELLPLSQVHSWITPIVHPYDLTKKRQNEQDIFLAEDYAQVEEWQKKQVAGGDDQAGGEEGAAEGTDGSSEEAAEGSSGEAAESSSQEGAASSSSEASDSALTEEVAAEPVVASQPAESAAEAQE